MLIFLLKIKSFVVAPGNKVQDRYGKQLTNLKS